jgi:N-dimethylarginine dimethylaminohydrolase
MNRYGLCSEYGSIKEILLYHPGPEISNHPDPTAILHLRPIDHRIMTEELVAIHKTFTGTGVGVTTIDPTPMGEDRQYLYNMMYCRDLFFMTPAGAIMANMAHETRRSEVLYAARTLKRKKVPIIHTVCKEGRFEGADALWINERLVAVGVGNRTNMAAFDQIRQVLSEQGIDCVALPSTQTATQHLLGTVQIVDRNLALVRGAIIAPETVGFLCNHGFTVIYIPENEEVRQRQAMNIVTIAPRRIIMTAGCPATRQIFVNAGLTVVAELEISQLINGAGGLACTVGIVGREESFDDTRSEMI